VTAKDPFSENARELDSLGATVMLKEALSKEALVEEIGTLLRRMAERRTQHGGRTDPAGRG